MLITLENVIGEKCYNIYNNSEKEKHHKHMATVLELRQQLADKNIDYPKNAKRADLETLLKGAPEPLKILLEDKEARVNGDIILIKDSMGQTIRSYHVSQFQEAALREKVDVYELFTEKAKGFAKKRGLRYEYPIVA